MATASKTLNVQAMSPDHALYAPPKKSVSRLLKANPFVLGLACRFRVYSDSSFKGWFVSSLLLAAWLGSLVNGPFADRFGRKRSILAAVLIFTIGSAIQAGAVSIGMLFAGRTIAGFAVRMLTMIVPMYMAEVSIPGIRGTLVVLQQLNITIGILVSYWLEYETHYIGGVRCAPDIPYAGGSEVLRTFDPYRDIVPGLVLSIGMLFYPESPRWQLKAGQDDKAIAALSRLRRLQPHDEALRAEFLAVKTEVRFEESFVRERHNGKTGLSLSFALYKDLVSSWPNFRRLSIGCLVMFFQQFMGCNAMIYYAPTIFGQLGLSGNTTSLLATGVYGIVNTLSTLPALFLIDKVGRRPLLMAGAAGTFVSLVIVGGIIGAYGSSLVNYKAAGWTGIAFIYIYDINFSYSFAPIGWVLPSEIFNLGNRSKAMSITTSTTWMCNFIIGLVTPDMLETIKWGTHIFFAAFCLLALAFTYFFIPETCGKSLEDMDVIFGDNAAHKEKARLYQIAAELRSETADGVGVEKGNSQRYEQEVVV